MSRRRRIIGLAASAAVCGSLLIAAAADGAAATWTGIGPYGGTVEAFAIDPRTPAVVFVGTWHGLFKSTDAGEHWKPVVAGLTHLSIKAVAVDPRDSKVVYAATARRLHRSVDGGETWSEVVKVPWADDPATDLHGGFEALAFPSAAPGTILLPGVEGI